MIAGDLDGEADYNLVDLTLDPDLSSGVSIHGDYGLLFEASLATRESVRSSFVFWELIIIGNMCWGGDEPGVHRDSVCWCLTSNIVVKWYVDCGFGAVTGVEEFKISHCCSEVRINPALSSVRRKCSLSHAGCRNIFKVRGLRLLR